MVSNATVIALGLTLGLGVQWMVVRLANRPQLLAQPNERSSHEEPTPTMGGIMIADYFLIRGTELDVDDLYRRGGVYEYNRGINPVALIALAVGIAPLVPGFLKTLGIGDPHWLFNDLYQWSWFVAFGLAGATHAIGMKYLSPRSRLPRAVVRD